MKPRPGDSVFFLCLAVGLAAASARGDQPSDPTAAIFTPSDLPKLARGVAFANAGERTVRVWSPSNQSWTLTREGDVVTLRAASSPGDSTPRWQDLGKLAVAAHGTLKIQIAEPPKADAKADNKEASAPPAAPALLVLDSDPEHDPRRLLDFARGRVDSTEPAADRRREQARTNREGNDFHAPATAAAWRDRSAHVRDQMRVALGLWPAPPKTPLNPQVYDVLERDGYTIEKVVLETLPGFTLSGNLYRPSKKPVSGKAPAILCPHGHWEVGRVQEDVQARCIRWAKLGAVVFMYDMVGYNDSKPFTHAFLNDRLRRWGLSLFGLQTWNSIRALDWLSTLPDVDPARIGCTGESGGGTQTFILTALDDRIKVSAPVVMVSDWFQGGCVCENAAGLRHHTDNIEFAALCAPRPMILVGASGDWTAKTMSLAFPAIRGVYSLVGSVDRIEAQVFDFPHNYNQTSRNAVYAFMGRWLLGIEDSASTREGDQTPEKPEAILTFEAKHPAPADRKTPEQLEAALIKTLGDQLEALSPAHDATNWQAAKRFLKTSLSVRVGLETPSPEALAQREVRRVDREGFRIVHSQIGRRANGEAIPVVRLIPTHSNGRLTVIADDQGKSALATPAGEVSELARALLARGQSVVGFDPLFVGESIDPAKPITHRPVVDHFHTYNPSVAADQMQDLATVVSWAGSQPDVREVSLAARGLAGFQALIARPLLGGLARTAVDLNGAEDTDGSGDLPAEIDLPGLFQFGGLRTAAALSAPAPLWIVRPGPKFAKAWPEAAYDLADAKAQFRIATEAPPADRLARWIDEGN
ncbi:alpha/beta hydrolase [Paludisphaera borealis]|uniref:Alpha/beta hydrolase: peptidase or carbohydrate esterase n=1 Tax=Paludisphaera borealis TaxID=1387353 RepID=A0A1U7CY92_9BACT|nr:CocE/NonD family hydrolase [Paludisphaera borealis]APW63922.1 alpha/beta hydrolase: peptidase or carbohydrate esterase [Paludisphaera borealis]